MSVSLHFPFADGRELAGSLPDHFTGETRFGPAFDAIAETWLSLRSLGEFNALPFGSPPEPNTQQDDAQGQQEW